MKVSKGEHGYISKRKKAQLIKTILYFVISASIFIIGLALNDWDKSNIFTIIAVLGVLPASKMMISFIILAPYHSVEDAMYERLIVNAKQEDVVYNDIVLTSQQKVMNLAILVIAGNKAIGLIGKKNENRTYIETYLNKGFESHGFALKAKIYEDEASFVHQLKVVERNEMEDESRTEWKKFLESLMV